MSTNLLVEIEPEQVELEHCAEFFEWWASKKSRSCPPSRSDFDPLIEKPHLAPHLSVWDVIAGGYNFRLRLIGTETAKMYGGDPTGALLTEFWGGRDRQELLDLLRQCVETGKATACQGSFYWRGHRAAEWRAVLAPLRGKGNAVEQIMVCACRHHPPAGCGSSAESP